MRPVPLRPQPVALYLRRERAGGRLWWSRWAVAAYNAPPDVGAQPRHRWTPGDPNQPTRRMPVVRLDSFPWRAVWLPDLKG